MCKSCTALGIVCTVSGTTSKTLQDLQGHRAFDKAEACTCNIIAFCLRSQDIYRDLQLLPSAGAYQTDR